MTDVGEDDPPPPLHADNSANTAKLLEKRLYFTGTPPLNCPVA